MSKVKIVVPQYWSVISNDMGDEPWSDIKSCKTMKEARQAITDYREKYPAGINRFRIVTTTTETVITKVTLTEITGNGCKT